MDAPSFSNTKFRHSIGEPCCHRVFMCDHESIVNWYRGLCKPFVVRGRISLRWPIFGPICARDAR